MARTALEACQKVLHCLKDAVTLQSLPFRSCIRESSYWEGLSYVNAASGIKFESVCNFSLCLWERWLFHNNSLLKVAAWLRGEGKALSGSTVGGCALGSLGEPPSPQTCLLCSSPHLKVHPVWRGTRWVALVLSTEGRLEWKQKNGIEGLWVESLLHSSCKSDSPWRKAEIYWLNSEGKLIFAEVFSVPSEMQVLF